MPRTRPRRRWPWAAIAAASAATANRLARRSAVAQLERGEAVRELATTEARFRSLSLAAAPITWSVDAGGRVLDAPAWRELTGQAPGDERGEGWLDAVHPEDRDDCAAAWAAAVAATGTFEASLRLDGEAGPRELELRAVPVVGEHGAASEWIGTATDVTARRAAERARDEAAERASALETAHAAAVARAAALEAARDDAAARAAELEAAREAEDPRAEALEAECDEARAEADALAAERDDAAGRAEALEAERDDARARAEAHAGELDEARRAAAEALASAAASGAAAQAASRSLAEPPSMPEVPGVSLSAARVLADEPTGAWSDAFMASDRHLALAVGEIAGGGAEAVGRGAQLAAALRAYALDGHGPGDAVARLNAVAATLSPGAPASLLYATLDLHTGTLRFVIAGTPAGVLLAPGRPAEALVAEPTPPVGDAAGALVHEGRLAMPRGASILLAAGLPADDAEGDPLAAALTSAPLAARAALDHVAGALFADGTPPADAALLLLQAASPEDLEVPDGSEGPVVAARRSEAQPEIRAQDTRDDAKSLEAG